MAKTWEERARVDSWSVGVAACWRIALSEAVRQRCASVEPLHVFIGVCSLDKALSGEVSADFANAEAVECIRSEHSALSAVFAAAGSDQILLRRAARAAVATSNGGGEGRAIEPSPQAVSVFRDAAESAQNRKPGLVGVLQLLSSFLHSNDQSFANVLVRCRVDMEKLNSAIATGLQSGQRLCRKTDSRGASPGPSERALADSVPAPLKDVEVTQTLFIDAGALSPPATIDARIRERLNILCDLPLQFAQQKRLDQLLETVMNQIMALIPGAERGAILFREGGSGRLLLKAHRPAGQPSVSVTLAERAMNERGGFIWEKNQDLSESLAQMSSISGMYAALVLGEDVLGVLCVDNATRKNPFEEDDLRVLLAVSRYAALAVSNQNLREDLEQNAALLSRLLTNFSPRLRDNLLKRARQGRLRLGGEKSEVTLLCSDIRGFTRLTADMDAGEVVDLLNAYFAALVDVIFRFNGTVDKYVGDAILAVFGSPEADAKHHENAIRAAFGMQSAMAAVTAERSKRGLQTCEIGIGVHCGEVLHGFIGAPDRMEFTVIGSAVNMASRYCDAAAPGQILISPKLHEYTWRMLEAEPASIQTKHEGQLPTYSVKRLR